MRGAAPNSVRDGRAGVGNSSSVLGTPTEPTSSSKEAGACGSEVNSDGGGGPELGVKPAGRAVGRVGGLPGNELSGLFPPRVGVGGLLVGRPPSGLLANALKDEGGLGAPGGLKGLLTAFVSGDDGGGVGGLTADGIGGGAEGGFTPGTGSLVVSPSKPEGGLTAPEGGEPKLGVLTAGPTDEGGPASKDGAPGTSIDGSTAASGIAKEGGSP